MATCPHCKQHDGWPFKWADMPPKACPEAGSFYMCLECGALGVFGETGRLRRATEAEFESVTHTEGLLRLRELRKALLDRRQKA